MSEYIIACDEETALWAANDVDSMKPIIRCRDCVHFKHWACEENGCTYCGEPLRVGPDGFCAWGERR